MRQCAVLYVIIGNQDPSMLSRPYILSIRFIFSYNKLSVQHMELLINCYNTKYPFIIKKQ